MKLQLVLALICISGRVVLGSWLAESKANQGDSQCPKGQVASGFIFKQVEESSASSQSSSSASKNSSQTSGANGGSASESAASESAQSSKVSQFKKIQLRVFCANLDSTQAVHSNSSGKSSGGRDCKSWTLKEGCKTSDQDKNCKEGEFISGIKLKDGGDGPELVVVCSKDDKYELDSSIEARTIGPIRFGKGQPAQAQNPSKAMDNGKCQVDAAVALGCDDGGVSVKIASFKLKGKQYDASCKQKKEEAAKEGNKTSSSNSTSESSTNSSSSSSTNSSSSESSNSTSEESMSKNETSSDEKSGGGEDCVCVCNQVCKGGKKGGKDSGSASKEGKDKKKGGSGSKEGKDKKKGGKSHHDNGNHFGQKKGGKS